jgi:hypothetical protein
MWLVNDFGKYQTSTDDPLARAQRLQYRAGLLTRNGDSAITLTATGDSASTTPVAGAVTSITGRRISGATILFLDRPNRGHMAPSSGVYHFLSRSIRPILL